MNQLPNRPPEDPSNDYPISGKDVVSVVIITLIILLLGFLAIGAIGAMELMSESGNVDMQQIDEWANGDLGTLPTSIKVAAMLTQFLLIIPAWVFVKRRKLAVSTYLRFRPVPIQLMGLSLIIGIGVAVVGDELTRLFDYILPVPEQMEYGIQRMMQIRTVVDFLTMGLTVVLVAPVVEELLFRGFFQRFFEAKRGVTTGVLLASALFALYHFNVYWLIPILLMATVMGAMAWRAESVLPSMMVHMTNNGLGLLAANVYQDSEPEWFVMGNHVHPLVLLVSVILLVWGLRTYFQVSEAKGLGGHGPHGDAGKHVDTAV